MVEEYKGFKSQEEEFAFEEVRYNTIASKTAAEYGGLEETQVDLRMIKMAELITHHDAEPSLNIGIGFCQLEKRLPQEWFKIGFDISSKFLNGGVQLNILNFVLVQGRAEQMPFADNSIPTITTQSTFQVLVDQEAFLKELARVLKPNGFYAITIEYHWNYPRKPQKFYAHEPEKLKTFLESLGLSAEIKYLNSKGEWCPTLNEGFSMWIMGYKNKDKA